jgi:hypothetical protein
MMSKTAMKLALEALNTTESDCGSRAWEREQEAITALQEALAEQPAQQEPLTDEHIERIYHRYGGDMINCARAIERAAQRTWVGLTIEDKKEYIAQDFGGESHRCYGLDRETAYGEEHMTWYMYLIGIAHTAVYVWAFWKERK